MVITKHLEKNLVLAIVKLADEIHRFRNSISEKYDLTSQQWLILLYLADDPNIPKMNGQAGQKTILASELADALRTSRPNITNLVNQLLKKGFVHQVKDNKDNRRKVLQLTSKGTHVLDEIEPYRDRYTTRLFEHLDPSDLEKMLEIVEGCLHRINSGQVRI
jgi:DNA-binding MarR family transcriptional regulator